MRTGLEVFLLTLIATLCEYSTSLSFKRNYKHFILTLPSSLITH